jgi:hypothetical protein
MAPQNRKVKTSKNKPPNVTKADSQTPTKFLICFFFGYNSKIIYKTSSGAPITL